MKNIFSIIIPVYNVGNYLKKCLDSVINQTYKDFEVIIVSDKSSDNSDNIVKEYVKKDNRFKRIYKENTGLSIARNIGIENSNGKYLIFLDSDDYLEENFLETLINNLDNEIDVLRFQAREIKNNDSFDFEEKEFSNLTGPDAFKIISNYHYIENAWLYCYKKDNWLKNNYNFFDNCIAEDYGLIPYVIFNADNVKSINYIGYNYVIRSESLNTSTNYDKKIKKMDDMFKQANYLKDKLNNKNDNEPIMRFINSSLIYYSSTLKYKDYKKYYRVLKENKCFDYQLKDNLKRKIKAFLIKLSPYFYYNYLKRLL